MNALRTAFAYFSILPAGFAAAPRAGALAALPLVGIVLGALAGRAGLARESRLARAACDRRSRSRRASCSADAIHLDGFLDACDALFASVPAARRFEILKDPRHGTFALAGLAIAVPAWLAAIAAIPPAAWPWSMAFCAARRARPRSRTRSAFRTRRAAPRRASSKNGRTASRSRSASLAARPAVGCTRAFALLVWSRRSRLRCSSEAGARRASTACWWATVTARSSSSSRSRCSASVASLRGSAYAVTRSGRP